MIIIIIINIIINIEMEIIFEWLFFFVSWCLFFRSPFKSSYSPRFYDDSWWWNGSWNRTFIVDPNTEDDGKYFVEWIVFRYYSTNH